MESGIFDAFVICFCCQFLKFLSTHVHTLVCVSTGPGIVMALPNQLFKNQAGLFELQGDHMS